MLEYVVYDFVFFCYCFSCEIGYVNDDDCSFFVLGCRPNE